MGQGNQFIGIENHAGAVRRAGTHIRHVILIHVSVIRERNQFVICGVRELREPAARELSQSPSSCLGIALCGYAENRSDRAAARLSPAPSPPSPAHPEKRMSFNVRHGPHDASGPRRADGLKEH